MRLGQREARRGGRVRGVPVRGIWRDIMIALGLLLAVTAAAVLLASTL